MATVLCIDDEEYLLEDISELMESCGHKAIRANDGKKGLQMILHLKPDLVISDISMPGMTGLELVSEVRTKHSNFAAMPIILLSALADRKQVLRGYDEGADDYLTKPVDFELLERKVKAALRQVERVKQKNEQDLIALVESLSESGGAVAAATSRKERPRKQDPAPQPQPQPQQQVALKESPAISPSKQVDDEIDWRDPPQTKTVYGATLNLKNGQNQQNYKNTGLMQWVADTANEIVSQLFPKKGAVTVNKNGGVFVCYKDADESESAVRNKQLQAEVQNKLKDGNVPKPIPQEDVMHLTVVAESPYQTEVLASQLENENFEEVVQKQITKTIPKIDNASELMSLMEDCRADLVLLKLLDRKGRELPIKFFNFNRDARQLIGIGFTNFDDHNLAEAGYKIDTMFLKLLAGKLAYLNSTDIAMIDVHYTTLIASEYQGLYIPKVKDLSRSTKVKLILNIRGVTKAAKSKTFKEVLRPLGAAAKGCTIQITPEEFDDFIQSPLPVSGIVCSYLNTDWDTFSADLVHKAKSSLINSRVPMIVRGVPSLDHTHKLQKFGFDGYGISEL